LCKIGAADIESQKVIPLYCEAYSHLAEEVMSENVRILKAIDRVIHHLGERGIHAIDRGGDRGVIYEQYLSRERPMRFVIRLRERNLIHRGKRRNCLDLAKALPTPHEAEWIVYYEGRKKKRTVQYKPFRSSSPPFITSCIGWW
jgi:hypothetical protein